MIFAKERGRDVKLSAIGETGIKIETPEYTDYAFLKNEGVKEVHPEVRFDGSAGWIRQVKADRSVQAMMLDGDSIAAFGTTLRGRGPWMYDKGTLTLLGGAPRSVIAM